MRFVINISRNGYYGSSCCEDASVVAVDGGGSFVRVARVECGGVVGDRVARDDLCKHGAPSAAKAKVWADKFKAGPGWYFLTGEKANMDIVLKKLGIATPRLDRRGAR